MSQKCPSGGMCYRQPDCADHDCPGHPCNGGDEGHIGWGHPIVLMVAAWIALLAVGLVALVRWLT